MSPEQAPILNVARLVKRFGGFYALDGLSFHITSGEILGLVGPNGSGKTTAINVISGLYAPDGGEVEFDGASIGGVASHRLVHSGINRTFQVPKPFLSLTVRENIRVALAYGQAGHASVAPATMSELLKEFRLKEDADRPAADLNSARVRSSIFCCALFRSAAGRSATSLSRYSSSNSSIAGGATSARP